MSEVKIPCKPGCTRHVDCVIAAWEQTEPAGVFAPQPEQIIEMEEQLDRYRSALEEIVSYNRRAGYAAFVGVKEIAREALRP